MCGIYGFMAKLSIATLNICQILMRFERPSMREVFWNLGWFFTCWHDEKKGFWKRHFFSKHFNGLTQFSFFIFTSFLSWARKSVRVSKEVAALILMHFHLSTKAKQKLQSLLFLRYFISFPPSFCLNVRSVL